jgi:hypothetical protein
MNLKNELISEIKRAKQISFSGVKSSGGITDFKNSRKNAVLGSINSLLDRIEKIDPDLSGIVSKIRSNTDFDKMLFFAEQLKSVKENEKKIFAPSFIQDEVDADWKEANACFDNQLYRSCVILCGRLLEIALHAKYFLMTNIDLLEKAPGTGLGNLIAKLSEKGAFIDPGLSNQIHLINQVRIHSVHKKQKIFHPSRAQAQAIMLYTKDAVEKLF